MNRRQFLVATRGAFLGLLASGCMGRTSSAPRVHAYGSLLSDPAGLIDLPAGFTYRVLSSLGDIMDDGERVPDKADGMGCFQSADGSLILVRNHELKPEDHAGVTVPGGYGTRHGEILPGGTTHLILDRTTLTLQRQFRSLGGTIRNCSGGVTPWGSWLSCEESPTGPGQLYGEGLEKDHGWVFEVPASARSLVDAQPLRAMGRFNHEAACVDPKTGIVYMTEDRDDSVLYRFIPHIKGDLSAGGDLQAMRAPSVPDTRNWSNDSMTPGTQHVVDWVHLSDVEAPKDDLRHRAVAAGATIIARGEGIHMGQGELYFCATSGGRRQLGQIFRLKLSGEAASDSLELFFESESEAQFNYGDNLTVAPNGHLVVCEDQYTPIVDNHLRGITPEGVAYDIGRLRMQTELAGACFSPDGKSLFVNAYSPARTLAITGPWDRFVNA